MMSRSALPLLLALQALAAPLLAQAPAAPPAPEASLAGSLATAPDEAARQALLAGITVSPALVQAVVDEAQGGLGRGDVDRALDLYGLAERLARQIDDQPGLAAALHGQGESHRVRGEYPAARALFEQGLELARAASATFVEGRLLAGLGLVAEWQGDLDGSLHLHEQSLQRFEAAGSLRGQALATNNIASIYATLGEPEESLPRFAQVLELARRAADGLLEGRALNNIGYTLLRLGRYSEAYGYLQTALEQAERSQRRPSAILALHNPGDLHVRQGDPERGLAYYRQGLELARETGLQQALANAEADVGQALGALEEHAEARAAFERSLALFTELEDLRGQASAVTGLAVARGELGDCAGAMPDFERALGLAEQAGAAEERGFALNEKADCELRLGRAQAALVTIRQALDLWRGSGADRDSYRRGLVLAGRAEQVLGQVQAARASFVEAAAIVEELRAGLAGGETTRERFLAERTDPYLALAELSLASGQTNEALAFVERSKGRVLLDVLAAGRIRVDKRLTPEQRSAEQSLERRLAELGRDLRHERQRRQPDPGQLAGLEQRLGQARQARQDFVTRLYAEHPGLRTLRGDVAPLAPADLLELAPDARTALAEYTLGPAGVSLFVVTREQGEPRLSVHRLGPVRDVARDVRELRRRLAARDLEAIALATRLYRRLLQPAEAQLVGRTRLVLIPDGVLWELPFQALSPRPGRYLVEERSLSYAPSLTVLREMQRHRHAPLPGPPSLLAFGNPTLGEAQKRQGLALLGGETLAPLPEAERQVHELARLYGSASSRVYVGSEASESRAKAEASRYRVLHFATHGLLDGSDPLYSQLVLASPGPGDAEDGLLEAREILELDLTADLAVLSACETGRGRVSAGEGLIGLSWAFFVAGVPTTVVSQWKVEAGSTAALMLAFHRELRAGRGQAEALQRAMRELLRQPQWRQPFFWAGFAVMGDGG